MLQIHTEEEKGDILVFMTGQEDIEDLESSLHEKLSLNKMEPMTILPLYANLPNHQQMKVFNKSEFRKIIIATNIAETSLTIDGVKYIVDSGLCKLKTFSATTGMDQLKITPISQNSGMQRAGRAGRQSEGKCYRVFTEKAHKLMKISQDAEILRSNLSKVILQLKAMGIEDVDSVEFLDKPNKTLMTQAFSQLIDLKSIKRSDQSLTPLGREMAILPTEPVYSYLLLLAMNKFPSILEEITIIVSMLSVEVFSTPRLDARKAEKRQKALFSVMNSDHLTLLNVYRQYEHSVKRNERGWCKTNFVHDKSLKKAISIKK